MRAARALLEIAGAGGGEGGGEGGGKGGGGGGGGGGGVGVGGGVGGVVGGGGLELPRSRSCADQLGSAPPLSLCTSEHSFEMPWAAMMQVRVRVRV